MEKARRRWEPAHTSSAPARRSFPWRSPCNGVVTRKPPRRSSTPSCSVGSGIGIPMGPAEGFHGHEKTARGVVDAAATAAIEAALFVGVCEGGRRAPPSRIAGASGQARRSPSEPMRDRNRGPRARRRRPASAPTTHSQRAKVRASASRSRYRPSTSRSAAYPSSRG